MMTRTGTRLVAAAAMTLIGTAAMASGYKTANSNVTEAEVLAAQKAWGQALVQISTDFEKGGINKARTTAGAILDAAYGYNVSAVLRPLP